jgi:hypothetical protein
MGDPSPQFLLFEKDCSFCTLGVVRFQEEHNHGDVLRQLWGDKGRYYMAIEISLKIH